MRNVGLIMTVLGVVMVLTQAVLLKPLVSRLGERKLVLLGSLLQLVSAVGLFTVSSLWAIVVFIGVFGLGYGISSPALQSLMTRLGSEQMAGRMVGWFQSVSSLALILGPAWGGYVFDAVSAGLMALAVALSVGIQCDQQAFESAGSNGSLVQTNRAVQPQTGEA